MEALLKRLRPETDFSDLLGPPVVRDSWKNESELAQQSISPAARNQPLAKISGLNRVSPSTNPCSSFPTPSLPPSSSTTFPRISDGPSSSSRQRPRGVWRSTPPSDTLASDDAASDSSGYTSDSEVEAPRSIHTVSRTNGPRRLTVRGFEPLDGHVPVDPTHASPNSSNFTDTRARFHGKSSTVRWAGHARLLKQMHIDEVNGKGKDNKVKTEVDSEDEMTGLAFEDESLHHMMPAKRRPEFWITPPWEQAWDGCHYDHPSKISQILPDAFPPPDLAQSLIDLYFHHSNTQFPLLHRPTFERQWASGLHTRDVWFACLSMSLFAVGSRWSDDERVLSDGLSVGPSGSEGQPPPDESRKWHRAGWKYFNASMTTLYKRKSILTPACLFEIQTYSLLATFLRGTKYFVVSWLVVSMGIRKAQDVGVHRRRVYGKNKKPSTEEELWKRAWWNLVAFDSITSSALGRPCSTREEDFDTEFPLEVDDEYWEHEDPDLAFKQPPGKPSLVTAFNFWVRLSQIKAFALRTLWAIDKSKVFLGLVGPDWRDRIMKELNDALTEWIDSIPPHLKWSSKMDNPIFANQATTIYTIYFLTQIMIYRPFIPPLLPMSGDRDTSRSTSKPMYPALSICNNAARSCVAIIESQLRDGVSNVSACINVAQMCSGIILMNVWSYLAKQKAGVVVAPPEDSKEPSAECVDMMLSDVNKFLKVLQCAAPRWENAGFIIKKIRESMPANSGESPSASGGGSPSTLVQSQHPTSYDRSSAHPHLNFENRVVLTLPTDRNGPDGSSQQQRPTAGPSGLEWFAASQPSQVYPSNYVPPALPAGAIYPGAQYPFAPRLELQRHDNRRRYSHSARQSRVAAHQPSSSGIDHRRPSISTDKPVMSISQSRRMSNATAPAPQGHILEHEVPYRPSYSGGGYTADVHRHRMNEEFAPPAHVGHTFNEDRIARNSPRWEEWGQYIPPHPYSSNVDTPPIRQRSGSITHHRTILPDPILLSMRAAQDLLPR
ncbi:hypothetical protein JAAARDRAFT_58100 [Jaapia argillacea MUCL 33604]|uniref:Xylanolytic transcriptional activator regulatory domain-containing protein n=1 Tax=Jaapia argillacea MUCL 33604 TaxID=933084 RepID=A0A067Q4I2_9AGAM|nr:hypothetical protein JAAARDRAFT_58100 [Jaapia argillacea MUCL 33604]